MPPIGRGRVRGTRFAGISAAARPSAVKQAPDRGECAGDLRRLPAGRPPANELGKSPGGRPRPTGARGLPVGILAIRPFRGRTIRARGNGPPRS